MPRGKTKACVASEDSGGPANVSGPSAHRDADQPDSSGAKGGSRQHDHQQADDSLDEQEAAAAITPIGPRQAKAIALQNQVWIQADGSAAARKRLAAGSPQPEAVQRRKRRKSLKKAVLQTPGLSLTLLSPAQALSPPTLTTFLDDHDDSEKENVDPVSIPMPSAPRKQQARKKRRILAVPPTGCDISADDEASSGGCTVTPDVMGSNSEDDERESDSSGLEILSKDPRLLKSALVKERPVWSHKKGKNLLPSLVIKSIPLAIKSKRNADESPTVRLALEARRQRKGKQVMQRQQRFDLPSDDIFATSVESDVSRATEPAWPAWTNLVIGPKNLKLTDQVVELQLVIRRTMAIVEERFIFEDSYPGLIDRNSWNRRAVAQACEEIGGFSPASVKIKYRTIAERSEVDREYLKEISSLASQYSMGATPMLMLKIHIQLDPRISLNRGIARNAGTSNIKAYGIFSDNAVNRHLVNDLLFKYHYIYAPKGRDYDKSKPYEHQAIIEVLRAVFFAPPTPITVQYPDRFKLDNKETLKLTSSMVALAATGIHHALDEWHDGVHRQVKFHINTYSSVYREHMKALHHIQSRNELAYNVLMRKLFRRARASIPGDVTSLLDVDNMDVEDNL
ncbi:hypothetical protein AX14_012640 [Amanita brunnescens Koide BX004]|nr:hypothetical protein AX14_012640 [Amanita brunnescens Koide BX004]